MSVRSDLSVNWNVSPRIITVLKNGTASEAISLQDLIDTLRSIEYQPDTMAYPYLIDSFGKQALGGGVLVGITLVLKNAKLAFEARSGSTFVQCNISGGNLVAVDANGNDMDAVETTAYTQIVKTSSSSATLQELKAILFASFNGGVTVDITSPYSGLGSSTEPHGTPKRPVNNITDAIEIANDVGLDRFFIVGNITFSGSAVINNFTVIGESIKKSLIIIEDSAQVYGTEFEDATITGVLDGKNVLHHCAIKTLNYVEGHIHDCLLEDYVITIGGSLGVTFLNCWSGSPGYGVMPTINCGGSGRDIAFRGWHGAFKLTNKTGSDDVIIDMDSGHITVDSTVIAGTVRIRGVGCYSNDSVLVIPDVTQLVQGVDIVTSRKMAYNKSVRNGDILTIYEDDGVTVWKQVDLSNGGRVIV